MASLAETRKKQSLNVSTFPVDRPANTNRSLKTLQKSRFKISIRVNFLLIVLMISQKLLPPLKKKPIPSQCSLRQPRRLENLNLRRLNLKKTLNHQGQNQFLLRKKHNQNQILQKRNQFRPLYLLLIPPQSFLRKMICSH